MMMFCAIITATFMVDPGFRSPVIGRGIIRCTGAFVVDATIVLTKNVLNAKKDFMLTLQVNVSMTAEKASLKMIPTRSPEYVLNVIALVLNVLDP